MYLRTLQRRPTPFEKDRAARHLVRIGGERAVKDLLWSLFCNEDFLHN